MWKESIVLMCGIWWVQELSTIALPQAFLPLACTANLAKNLAAVAASSTRAPIYRTFALQNNLAGTHPFNPQLQSCLT